MHPLSWNVYGGHYENVKLLLEHGAHVNADVDSGDGSTVTALDICVKYLDGNGGNENFEKTHKMLLQHGAKTFQELS